MSTKPFKDIEQMMRDTAEGFEMPFEEESWKKMEHLLDKDNDRRRPIFWLWWLLPILLGGSLAGYFMLSEPKAHNIPVGKNTRQEDPAVQPPRNLAGLQQPGKNESNKAPEQQTPIGTDAQLPATSISQDNARSSAPVPVLAEAARQVTDKNKINFNQSSSQRIRSSSSEWTEDTPEKRVEVTNLKSKSASVADHATEPNNEKSIDRAVTRVAEQEPELSTTDNEGSNTSAKLLVDKSNEQKDGLTPPANKKEKESSKNSRWFLILAAGAEGNSTKLFAVDKVTPTAGLNIGYQLNKKFSLQTGLFAGAKKYVAGPNDYNPKAGTYWSMVQIVKVDANCMVLEIPLDVRYNIKSSGNTSFFATAGMSSYIMKKEDYEYLYNHYGYSHYGEASYKGNKHFFSVVRLSAGLERKISGSLMLNAAPSLHIPLAGVGEGSVKLYAVDLMVGLRYQPLRKTKKK